VQPRGEPRNLDRPVPYGVRGPSAGTTNMSQRAAVGLRAGQPTRAVRYPEEIAAYVGFLAAGREPAIEYVLGLFEDADVVGFDFDGSPFGADTFDLFPVGAAHLTYADAFTGFVFHEPLTRHRLVTGVPEVIDSAFATELVRRFLVAGVFETERAARDSIAVLGVRRETGYEALPQDVPLRAEIERWRVRKQDGGGSRD